MTLIHGVYERTLLAMVLTPLPLSGVTAVSIDAGAIGLQGEVLIRWVQSFQAPTQVRVVLPPTRDATARRLQSRLQALGCTVTKRLTSSMR